MSIKLNELKPPTTNAHPVTIACRGAFEKAASEANWEKLFTALFEKAAGGDLKAIELLMKHGGMSEQPAAPAPTTLVQHNNYAASDAKVVRAKSFEQLNPSPAQISAETARMRDKHLAEKRSVESQE